MDAFGPSFPSAWRHYAKGEKVRRLVSELQLVEQKLVAIAAAMDTSQATCGTCQFKHAANWDEFRLHGELAGTIRKVRKFARILLDMDAKPSQEPNKETGT